MCVHAHIQEEEKTFFFFRKNIMDVIEILLFLGPNEQSHPELPQTNLSHKHGWRVDEYDKSLFFYMLHILRKNIIVPNNM